MKKTNLTLITLYFVFTLYFAVLNWDMFIVFLNISLGFTVLNIPLIIVLFSLGLVFLFIQWGFVIIYNLKIERALARKDSEITKLKAVQYDNQKSIIHDNSMSLKELHDKVNKIMVKLKIEERDTTKAEKKDNTRETADILHPVTIGQQD